MAFKSTMENEGILQLASIREVLELAGLEKAMEYDQIYTVFEHNILTHREPAGWWQDNRLNLEMALEQNMRPVVNVRSPQVFENFIGNSFHAVGVIGIKHIYGENMFVLKNSYGDKPLMYIPIIKTDDMPNGQWITEAFYIKLKLKK